MAEDRRVPGASLIQKHGLAQFEYTGPWTHYDWRPSEVRIPLQMHIGAPARAVVAVGDRVEAGQVIGAAPEGLGVAVHASISGTVTEVGSDVRIRA